jgi:hypothetical protein
VRVRPPSHLGREVSRSVAGISPLPGHSPPSVNHRISSSVGLRSMLVQFSTTFPPAIRKTLIPVAVKWLPVGGMPNQSPRWVPLVLQRHVTISPSAKMSSRVVFQSGKAVR